MKRLNLCMALMCSALCLRTMGMSENEKKEDACNAYRILINTVWQQKDICDDYCNELIKNNCLPDDAPYIDGMNIGLYALRLARKQDRIAAEIIPSFILRHASSRLIAEMLEAPADEHYLGPLQLAAVLGMDDLVRSCVTGDWPNGMKQKPMPIDECGTHEGCTPLIIAIHERRQSTAELLLSLGANPRVYHKSNSLLSLACVRGCDRVARKLIEEYKLPVDDVDQEKGNTLRHDLFLGDLYDDGSQESILALLLERNVPQIPNKAGFLPLDHAVWQGNKKGIEALAGISCAENKQAYEKLCNETYDSWIARLQKGGDQACNIDSAVVSLCTNEDILKKLLAKRPDQKSRDTLCFAAGLGGNIVAARLLLQNLSLNITEEKTVYRSNCLKMLKSAIQGNQEAFIRAMKAVMPKCFTANNQDSLLYAALMQDDFELVKNLTAHRLCQTTHVRCVAQEKESSGAVEVPYLEIVCDDGAEARYALIFDNNKLTMMPIH